MRILTAGLSRWGGPDVEAAAVPAAAADRIADVVLGVAEAIANGVATGPVTLSRDDLARAREESPTPRTPRLPDATPKVDRPRFGPSRGRRPERLHGAHRAGGRRGAARLSRSVRAVLRAVARGLARRGEPPRRPREGAARASSGARALVGDAAARVAARPVAVRRSPANATRERRQDAAWNRCGST